MQMNYAVKLRNAMPTMQYKTIICQINRLGMQHLNTLLSLLSLLIVTLSLQFGSMAGAKAMYGTYMYILYICNYIN